MSSGKSPMKATRSGRRAKRGSSQRTSRHMLCEMLEQRQLLAADLVLSANDGPLSNQSDDGTTDVFSIAPQVTANTLDVFINGQSALSGDSSAIGTLALNGSSDADSLTVDLSGAATTTLDIIPTASGATASWDFGGSTAVELTDFETIDATSGLFDLRIRQDLSLDYAADGLEDRIELELTDGGTRLLIRVNGVDQAKVGGAGSINVIGSSDIDTYVVNETSSGLPSAPIHVGDNANVPGVDNLEVNMATAHTVDYNSTTTGVPKSGVVSINGATDISYEGLAPVMINSAGGTLNVNAIDNPAITMLTIADDLLDTMGPGTNLITADGGFETLFFINASTLNVYGGAGSETITFAGTDPADITLTMVNLFGADFFDTDAGDDTIVVETLNPEITVNADGGDGGDTITIAGAPNSLDAISSTAAINVTGGGGTDLLQVLDGADTDNNAYTVNPTAVTRTSAGPAVSIGYAVDVETVEVEAGTGEDTFQVTPSTATEYDLDGNDPTNPSGVAPGDTLTVDISGFPGAAIAIGVTTGTISGGGMADIDFTNFEFVMTPPPVFFFPDAFEPNDSIADATILGSETEVTLRDLTIHDLLIVLGGVSGFSGLPEPDEDFFKITAHDTGKMSVTAHFTHINGDLDVEILDMGGNTIDVGMSMTDNEIVVFPVVTQEMYFIRVFGVAGATNEYVLEVENFAAPKPELPDLVAASDTGMMDDDEVTSNNTPTIDVQADLDDFANMGITIDGGPGTAGADVTLSATSQTTGVVTMIPAMRVNNGTPNNNLWTGTFGILADDAYFIEAWIRIEDGQGTPVVGRSPLSEPLTITIDTMDPAPPAIVMLASSDDGDSSGDNITSKMQPAFRGTVEPNAKVRLFADGELVGHTVSNTDGSWEITVEPLGNGAYDITGVQEDLAGNISPLSAALPIIVDPLEPNDTIDTATVLGSVPKITLNDVLLHDVNDIDVFKITAMSTGKQIINAFFDTNGGNVDIEVQDMGGNTIANGAAIAGGEGIVIPVVNQEMYFLLVTLADDPDVLFDEGNLYDLELENFTAPTPDKPLLSLVSDTGMMNDDNVTNVNTPNYFITADLADFDNMGIPIDAGVGVPGAEVILAFTNTVTGVQTTVEADRVGANSSFWSATPAALNDDVYLVQAWVRIEDGQNDPDAEVGRSLLSEPMLLTVDTAPPNVDVPDLLVSSDTGMDIADHVTNKMSPAFSGTAEPGAKVRILANGAIVGQSVATTDGRWEITVEPLRDGTYTITAEAEDSAGNMTTTVAMNPDLIVDSTEPNTPYLDLLNDRGHDPFDNITSAGLLNFLLIGDDTVDGNGNPFPNEIKYRLYWRAGDGLGEVLVYDSFAALGGFTANGQLNVIVSQNLNNPAGTPFPDGFHNFKLEVEDRAGNISHDFLLEVELDTATVMPTIDMIASSDTGMFDDDDVTAKMSPAFSGIGEADALLRVFAQQIDANSNDVGAPLLIGQGQVGSDLSDIVLAGTQLGGVVVAGLPSDGLGLWEVTVEPLDDGVYDIFVETEDWGGNLATSRDLRIEIDSIEPNTAFLDMVEASDSGRHNDDNITNNNTPTFTMTTHDTNVPLHQVLFTDYLKYRIYDRFGETNEVLVYDSSMDAVVDAATTNGDGFTSLTVVTEMLGVPVALADGIHDLKLEVEDRAGNISHDFLLDVLIDTQAFLGDGDLHPEADSGVWGFAATMADRITSAKVPSFFGVAEADNIVTLTVDGNLLGGTTVAVPLDGDDAFQPPNAPNNEVEGNWRIDSNLNLTDGEHSAVFTFEDPAGNRLSTAPLLFMVDTQGPRVTDVDINNLGNAFNIFDHKYEGDGTLAPTPLVNSLVVSVSDLPNRTANFLYDAVFEATAENPGHYQIRGDANGIIPIQSVQFDRVNLVAGQPVTGTITLIFAAPLPDDRFTLSISDDISDVAGNALDGESNASEPHDAPGFPSGDGQHGGDFVARFTVDSRAEIGSWGTGSVYIDTNGNFTFDPENQDFTNEDISYVLGFPSDDIFAGNFVQAANGMADGFDKLAAYGDAGLPPNASNFRWLIDTDNDGVPNINVSDPANINGLPVAGNFDFNAANGDEVGVFTGQSWWFDTTHNFQVNQSLNTQQRGLPIIGDFDGDGFDDLGTYDESLNRFEFDLTGGVQNSWDGIVDQVFTFNFIGIRERPVAADFDGDGHDDIGLWVPDRAGATPGESAEWYILVSGNNPITNRLAGAVAGVNPVFTPEPFQADLFAQFGDDFGLPVVGNFDPPVAPAANEVETMDYDVNGDGQITGFDALMVINLLDGSEALDGYNYDINGDNQVTPFDALMVINALEDDAPVAAMSSAAVVRADASESVADQSIAPPSTMEEVAAVGLSDQAISGVVAEVTSTPVSQPVGTAVDFADLAHGLLAVDDSDSPQDVVDEIAADITAAWMEE